MLIDLSHPFDESMPTYPGDSLPSLKQVASIAKDGYADHALLTTMHVGTHIDAPAHMIEGGKMIHELPLELFSGKGVVVDVRGMPRVESLAVSKTAIREADIGFFCTGY